MIIARNGWAVEPDQELRAGRQDPRLADLLGGLSARAARRAVAVTARWTDFGPAGYAPGRRTARRVPTQRIPMTTAPRLKITYATLRDDNEELHALYEAGLEKARARLGAYHRNCVGGAERDGDGTFELRSPIDRDILVGHLRQGHARRTSRTPSPRRAPPSRPGSASAGSERLAILRPRRGAHLRAPDGVRRADGHRGRQDAGSRRWARSRRPPT